jgi:predicted ABC-type exoprotein transport system permease subunit
VRKEANMPAAAWIPIVLVALGFLAYCYVDLAHHDVKYFPKWLWVVICSLSIPLGGIFYLTVGRAAASR